MKIKIEIGDEEFTATLTKEFSPKTVEKIVEAAVAVKGKRKGITVCLVHKNPRHFEPVKEDMDKKHGISVLKPGEYVDP